ncbi:DUF3499 family protein [Euzebya sp.]|uniref:DUF3499 family protein n=1 Tax=Euzebya sp. TaxID=1971409 RepID=UPI0035184DFD
MADMRSCIKTGCRWPAAATLSYRYATAEVWLSDLADDHPSTHDLCPHHADSMTVPRGWALVDDRRPVEAVHEPSAAEIVERVATLRGSVDRMLEAEAERPQERASRYSRLLADLPTYDPPAEDQGADDAGDHVVGSGRHALVGVGLSHEIAPVSADMAVVRSVLGRQRSATRPAGEDASADHADDVEVVEVDLSDGEPSDRVESDREPSDRVEEPPAPSVPQVRGAVVLPLPFMSEFAPEPGPAADDARERARERDREG